MNEPPEDFGEFPDGFIDSLRCPFCGGSQTQVDRIAELEQENERLQAEFLSVQGHGAGYWFQEAQRLEVLLRRSCKWLATCAQPGGPR